jgi:hypothetical protein
MKTGLELIAEERERQVSKGGWTALHDQGHHRGEIAMAAASYAACAGAQVRFHRSDMSDIEPPSQWPWGSKWWKPSDDPVRTLTKAGALIAAEIDRIQRLREHEAAIQFKPGARGLADA